MKKFFYITILMAALGFDLFSQQKTLVKAPPVQQNLKASLNHAVFYAPEKGTYLETYLNVVGSSVIFKKAKGKFQGTVKMEISFLQSGNVVLANAYNLHSPEILDTTNKPSFVDMQRYWLKPGQYDMEVRITDVNLASSAEARTHTQTITVTEAPKDSIVFSDFELLEAFDKAAAPGPMTKGGYDITPYVWRYYPETVNKLAFYIEAYNTLQKLGFDTRFVLTYFIEGAETKEKVTGYHAYSKQKSAVVTPLLTQFDIGELPTGEYNLVVEMRDNSNTVLAEKKLPFTRVSSSKYKVADIQTIDTSGTFIRKVNNLDTLKDYIACLWPISSTTEREWQYNQIRNANAKVMQQYIYAFWVNRDPKQPEKAWQAYRAQAVKVKKEFACGKIPGYQTDRGRVYLQYGAPSSAQQAPPEPESYPYEIWQYYRIKDPVTGNFQSNKKFVFYNRELDGNCYQLLHSDAKGEKRDDRWQIVLKQRTNQIMNYDQTTPNTKNYGSQAEDLFQNPR